jgi:hypothetical protein
MHGKVACTSGESAREESLRSQVEGEAAESSYASVIESRRGTMLILRVAHPACGSS